MDKIIAVEYSDRRIPGIYSLREGFTEILLLTSLEATIPAQELVSSMAEQNAKLPSVEVWRSHVEQELVRLSKETKVINADTRKSFFWFD